MKFTQKEKAEQFYQLHHQSEMLILPNIWEPLGAALLQDVGYEAIATSSSALAQANGYHDGENLPFEIFLDRLTQIASAVNLPVSADVEKGYADDLETLKINFKKLINTGIVGINLEDSDKETGGLVSVESQTERIKLAKSVAKEMEIPLFVNARVDTYVHGGHLSFEEKLTETIKRGNAYKDAGADAIFPILITDLNHIKTIIKEVSLPLNVMTFPGIPSIGELKDAGVARLSLGGSYIKTAINAMKTLAEQLLNGQGLEDVLNNKVNSAYMDRLVDLISK